MTSDGLTLFFESARSGNYKIYSASRNNTEAAFGVPALLRNVSEGVDYPSGGPYLSADDQTLYFQMVTPSGQDLYQSIRNLTAWSEPGLVFSATQSVAFPVVTSDELRLYIAVYDPSSNWNIWTATRTARNEPFSNGTPVAELNSEEAEFPAWLSPDGCRLYFDRGSDWKQSVVHVAERL